MRTSMRLTGTASAIAVALGLASATAVAQDTSASMRGSVLAPSGQGAANTRVIIEHVPSGSRLETTTDASGAFIASGLRVGGPYRVTLDSDVYRDATYTEVFLSLGDTYRLNAQLEAANVERISVTGSAVNYAQLNSGSSSSFGEEQIQSLPTYGRDLKEIVRLNPLAATIGEGDELVVAGNNPKYNSITVDGIGQNDDFGLNGNGYPTQRSPISIDAIEQITVDVVPFNAKDSNFTGAKINAVTKSGTNEFEGSVLYQYTSDSLAGNPQVSRYLGGSQPPVLDYEEKTYGISLGGPIIEDTLFFYVNYEKLEEPKSVEAGPLGSAASNIADVTEAEVNEVIRIAREVYGVDAGDWNVNPVEEDEKLLVKLDWNINNEHRSSFTYQNTDGNSTRNNNGGDSELRLSSHWYNNTQELKAYSFQLYSNWSSNFSSDMKLSYKEVVTGQIPLLGKNFGDVTVEGENARIALGPDFSRHSNELANDTLQFQINGEYLMGDHAIQFGYDYLSVDVFNLFIQNTLGSWTFDSIADFEAGQASRFSYQNAFTGNVNDGAAEFTQGTQSLYIQDTWQPTWDLELTFGVRYERMFAKDAPTFNQRFFDRYGFSNTENLDGKDLILPRVGFKYAMTEDFTLRGGFGRYGGGRPNVWISNAYTNDGVTIVPFDTRSLDESVYLNDVDITQVPQEVQDALVAGDGNTNPIDPNFELPTDWRLSLGFDWNTDLGVLGDDWYTSAEFIYSRRKDDVRWVDLARRPLTDANGNIVTTADGGRIIYVVDDPIDDHVPMGIGDDDNVNRYDLMLTNGDGGKSQIFTATIGKAWDNGLSFRTSYTNQDIEEAVAGSSSTATSNFRFPIAKDIQNIDPGTASYQIEHRFMADITYRTELFSGYQSTFGLFWERQSGRPFSYVLDTFRFNKFGDQNQFDSTSRYLPYIPTGADDPNVTYRNGFSYDQFAEYIAAAGLEGYAGGYAPRNNDRGPWNTTLDFKYTQELPGLFEGHKGELYFNIRNILAMFDKEAAQQHTFFFGDNARRLVSVDLDDQGRYVYGTPFGGFDTAAPTNYLPERSTWQAKIGIRYSF
ncbi:cell envelope biogenesis protein OmpA [Pseudidiomarina aestuarii]|uniref:Cell envelope biogenesis protein OmpA n=1 Tax=Pseudidiomarina aestuarii TaxID=624146 RepID=A0A7Z7ESS4_9GAMM|nr:TonB-dependent receptor [Pseudidiomarina aestuarii]RUO39191.1 cell envelope biogenesis protein OmpA [Pseudidiomarina aestuarii]